ncbi:MAG: fluoride efflux transporter CrcB, partial [Alphaproteobacteria bacterium]
MNMLVAIAIGGAVGALGRHFVNVAVGSLLGTGFPWGTVTVNIVGSFLMGVLIHMLAVSWNVSPEMRALLTVGVLGAFTTFSTFSLDVVTMYERDERLLTGIYIA